MRFVVYPREYRHADCGLEQSNGQNNTNCDGNANSNSGCGITEWSRASYGPYFDAQGGGVFAMKWDENGIAVCKYSFALH